MIKRTKISLLAMGLALSLFGCVTKTASTPTVFVNRSMSEYVTDMGIERQVLSNLSSIAGLTAINHRVGINVFRGELLLTGEVPNMAIKQAIEQMAVSIKEVKKVHNRLKESTEPKSQSYTIHENYLKAKYLGKLIASSNIKSSQYQVVVRDNMVYMMGVLTANQLQFARQLATQTEGVVGFVSLMTVLASNQEEADLAVLPDVPDSSGQMSGVSSQTPLTVTTSPYINLYQNTDSP